MIRHGGTIVWSASDLTGAAACEYEFLRVLDRKLGRAQPIQVEADPLQDEIAKIGLAHEAAVVEQFRKTLNVVEMPKADSVTAADLNTMAAATLAALDQAPDVVVQAGFFDGEFLGYADFLRRTEAGWVVADTKIARHANTSALLQIAAYADQLECAGLPIAPTAELILGTGEVQSFPLVDLLPVFRERRDRLRVLIAEHTAGEAAAAWDTDGIRACGSCADCSLAIDEAQDLMLVANLRRTQRRTLKDAGIHTVADLAQATIVPVGMAAGTFATLHAQAALQLTQLETDKVSHEVHSPQALEALPAPSGGDLFFDFEGDPMFGAGGAGRWGLEYLWGVLRARTPDGAFGEFWPLWADDRNTERNHLVAFLDEVVSIRAVHPDMHIYHYAPYEITALKRLVAEHKTHEAVLDDLLRHQVFIDLYAVVRASVRISQPSYSIKKLEPLYMKHARVGEVTKGDDSVAQYHLYRELRESNPQAAADLKATLLDYNHYDCESTLELRDWLLSLVPTDTPPAAVDGTELPEAKAPVDDPEVLALRGRLLDRSGPTDPTERTADEQAWAMIESALGYHRREDLPFWWGHFDRLLSPAEEWADTKDVIQVTSADVIVPWGKVGKQRLARRTLELKGVVGIGSTLEAPATMRLLYEAPTPKGVDVPIRGERGASGDVQLVAFEQHQDGTCTATVVEALTGKQFEFDDLPGAVVPGPPPNAGPIVRAIRTLADEADSAAALPERAAIDVLLRRSPRLSARSSLPHTGDHQADLTAALLDLDHSYLAVQGPPGTGKTYLGSHVIVGLVNKHRWKVGVVAQSHAVVENMLDALVKAGLDPDLIGKRDKRSRSVKSTWTELGDNKDLLRFCTERAGSGFVAGGTAWVFTGAGIDPGSLDLLVIDEAGQFALAPTLGVSIAAQRLLLLGDPQQLPQVSQGTHGEPVNDSALSWVIGDEPTMPAHLGYFLETSYRMHPHVCAPISRLSYAGELRSAPAATRRELDGGAPGVRVVKLDHVECSVTSIPEAAEVVRQVSALIGTSWTNPDDPGTPRSLTQSDFLVVAPYNAQRQLITSVLTDAGLPGVAVGTVDKFQGQEAPVVIVSMTASSADDVPRGMEFLLNRNRVNVAVSRAQWLAVLIRSRHLTAHLPTNTDRFLELGGFIGLCDEHPIGPRSVPAPVPIG